MPVMSQVAIYLIYDNSFSKNMETSKNSKIKACDRDKNKVYIK